MFQYLLLNNFQMCLLRLIKFRQFVIYFIFCQSEIYFPEFAGRHRQDFLWRHFDGADLTLYYKEKIKLFKVRELKFFIFQVVS